MPSSAARPARLLGMRLAAAALVTIAACGDDRRSTTTAPSGAVARTPTTPSTAPPSSTRPDCDGVGGITEARASEAMLVVQTLVFTWEDADATHGGTVVVPTVPAIKSALDTIRCDMAPRARSRHSRAIAKLLGYDWNLTHAGPFLILLGFPNAAAIASFKDRVITDAGGPAAFTGHAHDPTWIEMYVTRHLATGELPPGRLAAVDRGLFGASVAYAQPTTTPPCWQEEEPWSFQYNSPFVEVHGHVSVDVEWNTVNQNVDPQQWNVCGRYWSPPDPNNVGATLDGAVLVKPTWLTSTDPCPTPPSIFQPPDKSADPGSIYDTRYLLEQWFVPAPQYTSLGDSWFKNILSIQAVRLPKGSFDTHEIDYAVAKCHTVDNVDGAIDGSVWGNSLKTIIDDGTIETWRDGGRTHVRVKKTFQLNGPVATWLTQLNPSLHELNEELGEFACCQ